MQKYFYCFLPQHGRRAHTLYLLNLALLGNGQCETLFTVSIFLMIWQMPEPALLRFLSLSVGYRPVQTIFTFRPSKDWTLVRSGRVESGP